MSRRSDGPASRNGQPVRCAIYTRKSTEEGLEQEFNSLDAQRESAEAFVKSQAHEGWTCLPDRYDDGGFTGGNMDRPALQRLLSTSTTAALAIIKLLCGRLRDVSEHFEAIALHPIEVRLARLLLDTLEEKQTPGAAKVSSLTLGISQNELALLMGSTRQRANAALTVLEKAGAIRRSGDALDCNLAELRKIAQRD